jgi:hypothetical protein
LMISRGGPSLLLNKLMVFRGGYYELMSRGEPPSVDDYRWAPQLTLALATSLVTTVRKSLLFSFYHQNLILFSFVKQVHDIA